MPDAVIVSTARTPLCKSWRGAFNITHGATMGGHALRHAIDRARPRSGRHRRRDHGLREPGGRDRPQHRAADRDPRRLSGDDLRHDREPVLLVGAADDRDRGAAHHGRRGRDLRGRRRRIDLVRAERDEHAHDQRGLDRRAQAGAVLADAADGGVRGEDLRHLARAAGSVRRAQPAARRRGARRRQVQRRDRADDDDDEGRGQGDRRGVDEGGHGHARTKGFAPIRPTRACRRSSRRSKAA